MDGAPLHFHRIYCFLSFELQLSYHSYLIIMPKEFVRKRGGKRNAKKEDPEIKEEEVIPTSQIEAGPSTGLPFFIDTAGDHGESHRIVPVVPPQENMTVGELDPAAPFGLLDPDIKAYLISVDEKLREWENLMVSNTDDAETELEGELRLSRYLSQT